MYYVYSVEYILCLHLVNVTWPCIIIMINSHVTIYHTRSIATHWSFDNDKCHITAFRPISEAAHSWSYDNQTWWTEGENVSLGLCPCVTFSTSTTVHHLYVNQKWCRKSNQTDVTSNRRKYAFKHTHTHPFNGPLSGTTQVCLGNLYTVTQMSVFHLFCFTRKVKPI